MARRRSSRPPQPAAAEPYCNEICIQPDGTVSFKHLDGELVRLALELDPRDHRLLLRSGASEGAQS